MSKFDSLFNSLKRDKNARIIVGSIVTGAVLIGSISGIAISNHYTEIAKQEKILLAQKQEEETNKLKELSGDLEKVKETLSKLIQEDNESLKSINEKLTAWEKALTDKMVDEALSKREEVSPLVKDLVENQKNRLTKDVEEVKVTDTSKYSEEMNNDFNSKIKELEDLISNAECKLAYEKISEVKNLIEENIKVIVENEKQEEERQRAEEEEARQQEIATNENYYTGNTTSGGSSNSGSSSNSGGSSNDGGSNTPTPEPVKGLYETDETEWWSSKGIDIQSMPLGTPFYNSDNGSWNVLYCASDTTDYNTLLKNQFNGREGEYYVSGSFFGYLRSTGEKVRISSAFCN